MTSITCQFVMGVPLTRPGTWPLARSSPQRAKKVSSVSAPHMLWKQLTNTVLVLQHIIECARARGVHNQGWLPKALQEPMQCCTLIPKSQPKYIDNQWSHLNPTRFLVVEVRKRDWWQEPSTFNSTLLKIFSSLLPSSSVDRIYE